MRLFETNEGANTLGKQASRILGIKPKEHPKGGYVDATEGGALKEYPVGIFSERASLQGCLKDIALTRGYPAQAGSQPRS